MRNLAHQNEYWDGAADSAVFTHPLDIDRLRQHVDSTDRVLDFGCGYGRVLRILREHGFRCLAGLDISKAMAARARATLPDIPIVVCSSAAAPYRDHCFDAVILFAVLTCVPRDEDQRSLMAEVRRLLVPGGLLYFSDFLLRSDPRNLERYGLYEERFGRRGVFEIEGDAVLRHHDIGWIRGLMEPFELLDSSEFETTTMRGNSASGFHFTGRLLRSDE